MNASRACIATSTCAVPGSVADRSLPSAITLHLVMGTAHADSNALLGNELASLLDCSDIAGSRSVWSLRPFDPHTGAVSASVNAEVMLVLADIGKRQVRKMLSACSGPMTNTGLERRGVRMTWQGSYRSAAPAVELGAALRVLSPRAAVVLSFGGSGWSSSAKVATGLSAFAARFLREHGVHFRRTLVLHSPRREKRQQQRRFERGKEVLRFAASMLDVGHEAGHEASSRWQSSLGWQSTRGERRRTDARVSD